MTTRRFFFRFRLRPLPASSARIFLLTVLACELLASGIASAAPRTGYPTEAPLWLELENARSPIQARLWLELENARCPIQACLWLEWGSSATPPSDKKEKPYALIFGTVWGPDDRPVYGITVHIRRADDKPKKVRWELYSDHNGEFAQRVPAGETDYIVTADLKGVKTADGAPLHLAQEVKVHIYNDERQDIGLHLTR